MSQQRVTRLSLSKMIGSPPVLVCDDEDQTNADMEAREPPFSCAEKAQNSRMDSIFVVFPRTYGDGWSGIKIGDLSCRPTLVEKMAIGETLDENDLVRRTNHPNLVNLTDVSVCEDRIYFSYERTGASLTELFPLVKGDEIAAATICKKILHGLEYIHEVLNISHGDLNCHNIHISEDGEVKIGNIGRSLVQLGNTVNSARDIEAVYQIAATLLDVSSSSSNVKVSGLMADHFTKLPTHIPPQDVLKHPFFRFSQGCWYLSHLGVIRSFYTHMPTQVKPHSCEVAEEED